MHTLHLSNQIRIRLTWSSEGINRLPCLGVKLPHKSSLAEELRAVLVRCLSIAFTFRDLCSVLELSQGVGCVRG